MENNFTSIEKLVKFGIELTVAQQMVGTMNSIMKDMNIPGSFVDTDTLSNKLWYVEINNNAVGPLSEAELIKMLIDKQMDKNSLVWSYGMVKWEKAQNVSNILKLIIQLPPVL